MRVLVADDEPSVLAEIAAVVSTRHEVHTVRTGLQAIQECRRASYDVVILDIDFKGGINGFKIAEFVREHDRDIRIVMISAFEDSDASKFSAVGATFFQKPIDGDRLLQILEEDSP